MSFGVFGLGNKQYEHFCAVGKRMHRALAALGATALVQRGEGDDDDDIEADFEAWRTELYAALDKATVMAKAEVRGRFEVPVLQVVYAMEICCKPLPHRMALCKELLPCCMATCAQQVIVSGLTGHTRAQGPPGVTQVIAAADSVPGYEVEVLTGADAEAADAEAAMSGALASGDGTAATAPYGARVAVVRELHNPASERSCLHVELDVSGSGMSYEAGDHVRTAALCRRFSYCVVAVVAPWRLKRHVGG